jgi:alpha-ribazole phosphatase
VPLADPAGAAEQVLAALGTDHPRFDLVWASPLSRCVDPARAIAARLQAEVRIDDRLREIDFGRWDGRPWNEIEREEPSLYAVWMRDWLTRPPPEGESIATFEARVAAWARGLAAHRRHLLIAHAGVVRALRVIEGGVGWIAAMGLVLPPLALAFLEVDALSEGDARELAVRSGLIRR